MATLKSYLTTIADAIRQKKGTTEPIKGSNFVSEILSIQSGGNLNVAYSLTPPADTSKIWLQCEEPTSVEVQNYLGECAVSEVANWGSISNPVDGHSSFYSESDRWGYFSSPCYIGNNQIAIVGFNHIRIYDLISKSYIADYTISVGTSYYYSNILYKDNVLYFAYDITLYSFDLETQTLTKLCDCPSSDYDTIKFSYFYNENSIRIISTVNNSSRRVYQYNLLTKNFSTITSLDSYNFYVASNYTIKVGNTIYQFCLDSSYNFKFNIISNSFATFTSFKTFMNNLGWTIYKNSSAIYDGERYIYLIGGIGTYNGTADTKSDLIIKYDTVNDTFELLDNKLIGAKYRHFSVLADGRVYIFGGYEYRKNLIDYFDLSYPLTQNSAIITTNTINTDNNLPLINTEKLKLNSNIASAYKGNADNLAEKVNAYYWNGSKWVGINCEDYVESESSGTGGGLGGGGDATTDPDIPVDKPVEM